MNTMTKAAKKKMTVGEVITNQFLEYMEQMNLAPWKCGYSTGFKHNANCNGKSKRPYRGPTALLTMMSSMKNSFSSPYWFSMKGVKDLGGRIKQDQFKNSTLNVGFFETMLDADGRTTKDPAKKHSSYVRPRFWKIWNLDQLEGVDRSKFEAPVDHEHDPIPEAETLLKAYVKASGITVKPCKNRAFYRPSADMVCHPAAEQYEKIQEYYSTGSHEFAHSTGHEKRLNRKGITGNFKFGSEEYAYEELVAEITAGFFLNWVGFEPSEMENNGAYVKSWLKTLKDNPDWILKASCQAQKAFDLLVPEGAPEPHTPKAKEEKSKPKPKKKAAKKAAKKKAAKRKTAAKTPVATADDELQKKIEELKKQLEELQTPATA